jgi:hypothetical protein
MKRKAGKSWQKSKRSGRREGGAKSETGIAGRSRRARDLEEEQQYLAAKGPERVNFTQNATHLHMNEYFAGFLLYCIAVHAHNPNFLNATYIIISELKTN